MGVDAEGRLFSVDEYSSEEDGPCRVAETDSAARCLRKPGLFKVGDRIEVQFAKGSWYPGSVTGYTATQYAVCFDDGDKANDVTPSEMRKSDIPAPAHRAQSKTAKPTSVANRTSATKPTPAAKPTLAAKPTPTAKATSAVKPPAPQAARTAQISRRAMERYA